MQPGVHIIHTNILSFFLISLYIFLNSRAHNDDLILIKCIKHKENGPKVESSILYTQLSQHIAMITGTSMLTKLHWPINVDDTSV